MKRRPGLMRALERTIHHTAHVHSLHGGRDEGNSESDGDQIERRSEAGRFLSNARAKACRMACGNRGRIQPESVLTSLDYECFRSKRLQRNWFVNDALGQHMCTR